MIPMSVQRWWGSFVSTLEETCIVTHSPDILSVDAVLGLPYGKLYI